VRPHEARLREIARERGYVIAGGLFTVSFDQGQLEWRLSPWPWMCRKCADQRYG
jgi:hypothetical protein